VYVIAYERMSTSAPAHDTGTGIGQRVRALREAMDLSLRDLAERSGLELRLSQLLRLDEDGAVTVVRAGERRKGPARVAGHGYEILTPPLPGQRAELSRHTLAPGAVTGGPGDPPMHEPGSRETALVERGTVVLHYDGQRYELLDGDCVTFDADLNHHFENPGPDEAVLLAVLSAGLRRS